MKKDRSRTTTLEAERQADTAADLVEEEARAAAAGADEARRVVNHVRELREALLMSKAELARKAGLSALTIDRVENGYSCRVDTKRKIILALGLKVADKERVFES